MTPGQIMEAEISASTLGLEDDDQAVQPQEPATSSSTSSSLRLQDQDHLGSDTLPEDLFTSDVNPHSPSPAAAVQPPAQVLHKPPVITEETEVDTDEVEDEASNATSTTVVALAPVVVTKTTGTRKRPGAAPPGGITDIDSSPTPGKRGTTPMRTRQRNVSSNIKKSGIGITESSRSSIISSKKSWKNLTEK